MGGQRCCRGAVEHTVLVRRRAAAAVVAAILAVVAAACADASAPAAAIAANAALHSTPATPTTTSSHPLTSRSTPGPRAFGGVAASAVASGDVAGHSSQETAPAAGRGCSEGGSGFSVSIATGQSGAPTPAGALQLMLSAPYEPGYSAAVDQWHRSAGSAKTVIYSAGSSSLTISQLPNKTWIVTGGETCAPVATLPARPSSTDSH